MRSGSDFINRFNYLIETSQVGAHTRRLTERYDRMIAQNIDIIQGKRVLDLASHDGRWGLAAKYAGAVQVVGIEGRKHLVKNSISNAKRAGYSDTMTWIHGDIVKVMQKLEPGSFDTVFLFGVFYHVTNHLEILREIARLRPTNLILDTEVFTQCSEEEERVVLWVENSRADACAIHRSDKQIKKRIGELQQLGIQVELIKSFNDHEKLSNSDIGRINAGMPSMAALQKMLLNAFTGESKITMIDWTGSKERDYGRTNGFYGIGQRFTMVVSIPLTTRAHSEGP